MMHRVYCLLASTLGPLVVRLLCGFVRVKVEGFEHVEKLRRAGAPIVYAFWHSRLLYLSYSPLFRGTAAMVSQHRDGEYIARVIQALGSVAVRGSTSRNATRALAERARLGRSGVPAGLTVDGPRGPAEQVQGGVIELASLAGATIVPLTFHCRPAWRLKSWDRFLVPRGYGRGILLFAPPIEVPSPCSRQQLEEKRLEVQRVLDALTQRVEREATP